MDNGEIQEAFDDLAESCPQQAMHSTCRLPRPNFQHKISEVRGEKPIVGMELGVPTKPIKTEEYSAVGIPSS